MKLGPGTDKHPLQRKPRRGKSRAAQFFRPLAPFAPSESDDDQQLPDWVRSPGSPRRSQANSEYNFDWLSEPAPARVSPATARANADPEQPPQSQSPPLAESPLSAVQPTREDSSDKTDPRAALTAEYGQTDAAKKDDSLPPAIEHITASTPEQTLKTARTLSQDGKMQAALGHYLQLVKTDQKLKQVVADLEAQRANPHIVQTPLMLQTLADAYTKTGKLAKALPLYRQALGR
ncbi:MAG TPA: hypothetical protein QGI62_04695 [Anaerolineales bacterium]|nr:hypothetical protein [Anaerolineales bacterium]|tara:strand:- start:1572 stop:2273 length:702 start_codon:yes stop_codon:yes gene_type:complete